MGGAHFYKRHGAQTTLEQQITRANTGLTPDGVQKNYHPHSTRFMTHIEQLNAVQRAMLLYENKYKIENQHAFTFEMEHIIGEGVRRNTTSPVVKTSKVRAYFKSGKLSSLFPDIS